MTTKKYKFIDLFAGIGGFHRALHQHGEVCVYASEWDESARKTYQANYEKISPEIFPDYFSGDITKVNEADIPPHDIICGGFPCQAFSISGKRSGFKDTRGTLFFDVARIAKFHQPKVLFLENVKNFAKHDNGNTLATVVKTLDQLGYDVFHKVLNASHYGAPTSRQRIYIVAFRKDLGVKEFNYPEPNHKPVSLKDYLDDDSPEIIPITRPDVFLDLEKAKNQSALPILNRQRPLQMGKINKGGQGERIYNVDGHAITLSAYGGGAVGKTGGYYHNGVVRRLTTKECAKIMGFGDNFIIPVSTGQAYKQFGNSVVVDVVSAVYSEIKKTLAKYDK